MPEIAYTISQQLEASTGHNQIQKFLGPQALHRYSIDNGVLVVLFKWFSSHQLGKPGIDLVYCV